MESYSDLQNQSNDLYKEYKIYQELRGKPIEYGTAGIRDKCDQLDFHSFKIGILTALYSLRGQGKALGVMFTASHNPIQDNGLKVVDFDAGMLNFEIQKETVKFCELESVLKSIQFIQNVLDKVVPGVKKSENGLIFVGRDTRPSGVRLSKILISVATQLGATVVDIGEITTPMLHHIVGYYNNNIEKGIKLKLDHQDFINQYFSYYNEKFNEFFKLGKEFTKSELPQKNIILDGSNGIGGSQFQFFIDSVQAKNYKIERINTDNLEALNHECGADFVNMKKRVPTFYNQAQLKFQNAQFVGVSFDGDADRIVYYLSKTGDDFQYLNGDKITCLYATFIKLRIDLIRYQNKENQIIEENLLEEINKLRIGAVQTAYANGSSTNYMKNDLNLITELVATGVQHSHPAAHAYDIGIYFEANGHGTFVVHDHVYEILDKISDQLAQNQTPESNEIAYYINSLKIFLQMNNQCAGDAMVNLLCIEAALYGLNMSYQEWSKIYNDLENLQIKVTVQNQNGIQNTQSEDKCISPAGLQQSIESICKELGHDCRCFVRPSGTQDIVRIYAQGSSTELVQELIELVSPLIIQNPQLN